MRKSLLLPLMILFISGCDLLEESTKHETADIDSRIIITPIYAPYAATENKLFLTLKTEKEYPCMNYSLISYSKKYNNALDIYLKGIEEPEICLTAFGPAAMQIDLADFNGEYELTVRSKDFSDKYKLIVREDSAFIEGDSTTHTKPVNTMWIR